MINTQAFDGAVVAFILLSDLLIVGLVFANAGPSIVSGHDGLGRPLGAPSYLRRFVFAGLLLVLAAFLAIQVTLVWRFAPYYLSQGDVVTEAVIDTSITRDADGEVLAYWITTEHHRFGVSEKIYRELRPGSVVEARYRTADDLLYEIRVVDYHPAEVTGGD